MDAGEEALAEVAADDLFRLADGREVGSGVPFEEQVEIGGELGGEAVGGWSAAQIGSYEVCDAVFGESCHGRLVDFDGLALCAGFGEGLGFGYEAVKDCAACGADLVGALWVPLDSEQKLRGCWMFHVEH